MIHLFDAFGAGVFGKVAQSRLSQGKSPGVFGHLQFHEIRFSSLPCLAIPPLAGGRGAMKGRKKTN